MAIDINKFNALAQQIINKTAKEDMEKFMKKEIVLGDEVIGSSCWEG